MKKFKKGFTLVELVIVIAVIAVLAAVLIPTFSALISRAKENSKMTTATATRNEFFSLGYLDNIGQAESYIIEVQNSFYVIGQNGSLVKEEISSEDLATQYEIVEYFGKTDSTIYRPVDNSAVTPSGVAGAYDDNGELIATWEELVESEVIVMNEDSVVSFDKTQEISSVIIPDTVKQIGVGAFSECVNIETIVLPDTLEKISSNAFGGCTSIEEIIIPASVTEIGQNPFKGCGEIKIIIDEDNETFNGDSTNSSVYLTEENKLIIATNDTVIAPETLVIGSYAFNNLDIEELVIPANVTSISSYGINFCQSLETITFEDNSLIETLGYGTVYYCQSLDSIHFGDGAHLSVIKDNVFYGCNNLTTVTFGSDSMLTTIKDSAFRNLPSISNVAFPETITSFSSSAFDNDYYTSCQYVSTISNVMYYACGSNSKHIAIKTTGNSVTSLPNGVKVIASYFGSSLTGNSFTIPGSVITIGHDAFSSNSNIRYVTISTPSSLKTMENYAFNFAYYLTSINFPEGLETIGNSAFYSCRYNLSSISFPSTLRSIGTSAFFRADVLSSVSVNSNNQYYYSSSNCLIERETNRLVLGAGTSIPYGVEIIGASTFASRQMTSISIPSTVRVIEDNAFQSCSKLTSVSFPSGLESIGSNAFNFCSKLTSVNLGSTHLSSIGSFAFCASGLTGTLTLPSTLTKVSRYAFQSTKITSVILPDTMEELEDGAFYSISTLTSANIPASLEKIASNAFAGTGLTSINVSPQNEKYSYSNGCFIETETMTLLFVVGSVSSIPEGIKVIGEEAFDGNTTLKNVVFPASLEVIGDDAFWGASLTSISFAEGSNLKEIGSNAFYRNDDLESVTLPEGLETIGYDAFGACESLEYISIPSTVTSIGGSALTPVSYMCDDVSFTVEFNYTEADKGKTIEIADFLGIEMLIDEYEYEQEYMNDYYDDYYDEYDFYDYYNYNQSPTYVFTFTLIAELDENGDTYCDALNDIIEMYTELSESDMFTFVLQAK